ncbi:hypothetical protein llap_19088 [Limosa lapponica baueri]|uniref:E3 ubiquitin-protein ligase n=1 Tax=Limosa lapponica baueri TaxID=1758121 RepID=A0A2I0T9Y7_LIMLA|nr:hypothetical protein llap_19088 [Limosa lapponica baueri]
MLSTHQDAEATLGPCVRGVGYIPRDNSLQSETVHYKRGVCQQFCVPSHTVDPSEWSEEELGFDLDREVYPMVVHAVVDEGEEHIGHCHVLLATFEKNSSILAEEEEEKSCTESELRVSRRRSPARREEGCGATPESENLTLSSSGAIDQSSCTGTPLSSTISSPEEPVSSSLAQSVMSMASSQSQHSQLSTDTVSSMSGSYVAPGTEEEEEEEGDMLPSPAAASGTASDGESTPVESLDINFVSISAEERDAEGNDVLEEEDASPTQEDGPEAANNNVRLPGQGPWPRHPRGTRDLEQAVAPLPV